MGVIFASLMPTKAQAILNRAAGFAENRLSCGVHFRSDIEAGQTLGTVIATDLRQDAAFRRRRASGGRPLVVVDTISVRK
jgi:acid phosphatase (class A)